MTIYKNWGVLAHEKQPVYTCDNPITEAYDVVNVRLPDNWTAGANRYGETLIAVPNGKTYLGDEILTNWGDAPALRWYDGHTDRHIILEVI